MRVVFFGTPEFALPSLKSLAASKHDLAAVITRPDRPRGRGQRTFAPSPVAAAAAELGMEAVKPEKAGAPDFLEFIRGIAPDLLAVAAYGGLLPDSLLALARHGGLNIHPSLLPRWRGPAPVHRAIWAGDAKTGVTIMQVAAKLDAGPIVLQRDTPIGPEETRGELESRLAPMGAELLLEAIDRLSAGALRPFAQDEAAAAYAPVFAAEEMRLDWRAPAENLGRLIRALAPSPGAHFVCRGQRVKVWRGRALSGRPGGPPGSLLEPSAGGAWNIACGEAMLEVSIVQPEGRDKMAMNDFLIGRRLKAGDTLMDGAGLT